MKIFAPAKINLWLSVGPARPDGYHEIVSVMQAVSLFDEVELTPAEAATLDVEPPGSAPEDDSNLVVRALRSMRAATGSNELVAIRLRKAIPAGAGLGGGSADAAATLVGLNELWRAGMSRKAIEKLGASLGADVPFCVRGGTSLARGVGEDLSPLSCPAELWWVIASDGSSLDTATIYHAFDDGTLSDPHELADALARGDVESVSHALRNDLTDAALDIAPTMSVVRDALGAAGALGVVMTGSGSAWCGLARDAVHARQIASDVSSTVAWCRVASALPHGPRTAE